MCHFLHCVTTPVWTGVGVAPTSSVFEGETATGVAVTFVRVVFTAVVDGLGVGAVKKITSELGGWLLPPPLELLPSRTQYRKPFFRTQSEGLSLVYDSEGFNLVKSSTFTAGATLSHVLSAVTRVDADYLLP